MRVAFLAITIACVGVPALADDTMTVDFRWSDTPRCSSVSAPSPSFTLEHVPAGTTMISLSLMSMPGGTEFGGSTLAYKGSTRLPSGAFFLKPPCVQGDYQWTLTAKDQAGRVLAIAKRTRALLD